VRLTRLEIGPTELAHFFAPFVEELSRAGFLFHPSVHSVFEFGQVDGMPFYTAEDVEGLDLRAFMVECRRQRAQLPIPVALFIAREVAGALVYAHSRRWRPEDTGVCHTALLPQKIFLTTAGEVKVGGFGLYRALNRVALLRGFVDEASTEFLAPETITRTECDARTDVYGCAALLYALLTFRSPREAAIAGKPAPLSSLRAHVRPELDALCALALSERIDARVADATELWRALGAMLEQAAPDFSTADLAELFAKLRDGRLASEIEERRRSRLLSDTHRDSVTDGASAEPDLSFVAGTSLSPQKAAAAVAMTAAVVAEGGTEAATASATGRGSPEAGPISGPLIVSADSRFQPTARGKQASLLSPERRVARRRLYVGAALVLAAAAAVAAGFLLG
jgi:serine/threonine-protein kinase